MQRRNFLKVGVVSAAAATSWPVPAQTGREDFPTSVSAQDIGMGYGAKVEGLRVAHIVGLDGLQVTVLPDRNNPASLRRRDTQYRYRDAALGWHVQINSIVIAELARIPLKSDPVTVTWIVDALDCATVLGAKVVLIPILGQGHLNSNEETARVIAVLKELCQRAEAHGVVLGLKFWCSAQEQIRILEAVDDPSVSIYYDLHNAAARGWEPLLEIPILGPYLCEVHIKNMNNRTGPIAMRDQGWFDPPTPSGRTQGIDHPALAAALKNAGYHGWLTLEQNIADVNIIKDDVRYVREVYG